MHGVMGIPWHAEIPEVMLVQLFLTSQLVLW